MPLGHAFLECCAICYLCDYELDKQTVQKKYPVQVKRDVTEVPVSRVNHYSFQIGKSKLLDSHAFEYHHYQKSHYNPVGYQGS
jgi:hypothetical protein